MDRTAEIFQKQREYKWKLAKTTAEERVVMLKKLDKEIMKRRSELHQAIFKDFQKHPAETDLTEFSPTLEEVRYICANLKKWMKPKRVGSPLQMFSSKSSIQYQPKGQVLIFSAWNYPFNLAVVPLLAAVAAGNTVILKPSEKAPNTALFLKELVEAVFDEAHVAVVIGEMDMCNHLLAMPFDHIFFTGSSAVGSIVMQAAAKTLSSVTLELGGKSPVVIDESANITYAAERIVWSKFVNAGQTCVAPDYVFIHETKLGEFTNRIRTAVFDFYGKSEFARKQSKAFCRLISEAATLRLQKLLRDTEKQGAKIEFGGVINVEERFFGPTILTNVPLDSPIMQEEIFGPVLPIITYKNLDEPISYIQSKPKPLSLYIFSTNDENISRITQQTSSGSCCVNHALIQLANFYLPFGGVGASGIGSYHGEHGFRDLSHARAVLQYGFIDVIKYLFPPYDRTKVKLVNAFLKKY